MANVYFVKMEFVARSHHGPYSAYVWLVVIPLPSLLPICYLIGISALSEL